jgi:hypothetical protein
VRRERVAADRQHRHGGEGGEACERTEAREPERQEVGDDGDDVQPRRQAAEEQIDRDMERLAPLVLQKDYRFQD